METLETVSRYLQSNCFSWRSTKFRKAHLAESSTLHREYTISRKLGQGGYGTVYLVSRKCDGTKLAAKIIPVQRCRRVSSTD